MLQSAIRLHRLDVFYALRDFDSHIPLSRFPIGILHE